MAASYPGAVKTFSAVVNGVTKLVAALFNSPYDEITAVETELGIDVAGTYTDVKTRLDSTTTFGAWVDKSASYAAQQAATDGFVVVSFSGTEGSYLNGFTDANADPTTQRLFGYTNSVTTVQQTATMPVKRNDYWKITISGGMSIIKVYWIPLGS